ncbi:beta-1,4-N-acetylgalactosaminyltransferase bre-4 [Anabrus simplex]|uniref:beta-1,4-N-acetylgalactosaminyltransferase bre-4 n=1 Tax=Anabrus simplex TaxID=316456 RepID=UPI0035A27C61
MVLQPWLRTHLYKVLVVLVVVLLLLQYAFNSIFEARQLEPLFAINSSSSAGHRPIRSRERGLLFSAANGSISPSDVFRNATDMSDDTTTTVTGVGGSTSASSTAGQMTNNTTPLCPPIPPKLVGAIRVLKDAPPLAELEKKFPALEPGGHYHPQDCRARHKVAIIVPYRDRESHLAILLLNLHPLLQRQQLDYQIFIVEQAGNGPFNRAMLMNVGFAEAIKLYDFECFIFHDVDLLPEDDRNLYTCPEQPRHMSVAIDVFKYKLPYADIFGGVSAMTRAQFEKVNGFSNMFWGWGGEDDDMSNRIKFHGFHISRYPANIARYKMLTHRKQKANPKRYEFLNTGRKRFKSDGINSLRYERKDLKLFHTYTLLLVELAVPS